MSKELEEIKSIVAIHFGALGFLNTSENEQILKDRDKVLNALTELQSIKEANPSEALECLEVINNYGCGINDNMKFSEVFEKEYNSIKQALLKAEQDKKKLNEIEKLTHLLYSGRRKLGQEYVKWCEKNNAVFEDATTMITWVLRIKLKEVLKE